MFGKKRSKTPPKEAPPKQDFAAPKTTGNAGADTGFGASSKGAPAKPAKGEGGFATAGDFTKHTKEMKNYELAVTEEEMKVVALACTAVTKAEEARSPSYEKKIQLRKDVWEHVKTIFEAGQVENQRLMTALKAKIKVEKDHCAALNAIAKASKSNGKDFENKGMPEYSPMDDVLHGQAAVATGLAEHVTFLEKTLADVNTAAGEYVAQVSSILKTGVDLLHLFQVAQDQVKNSLDQFLKISNVKAISENNKLDIQTREKGDISKGENATINHDLWFGEMKYRVAIVFCQSSFESYDETFNDMIQNSKQVEIDRRNACLTAMKSLIEAQEKIKYKTVPKEEGKEGELKSDATHKKLVETKKGLDKNEEKTINKDALEPIDVIVGELVPYPDISKIGGPLESNLLTCHWAGEYKPPGVSLSGFQKALILRTIDDHLHFFNIPKGTPAEQKPEEIFSAMIPAPHAPKVHRVKKKSKTTTIEAPKKSSAEKKMGSGTSTLIKPDFTVAIPATDAYKMNNNKGDIVMTQRIKKTGMMGGEKTSKFILHTIPENIAAKLIGDNIFQSEKEWKAARG